MRTLVIGGSRNLGPSLVAALVARGDTVTVLNRGLSRPVPTLGNTPVLPAGIERLTADRGDAAQMRAAFRGRSFDLVVDTTLYTGPQAALITELFSGRTGRYVWWSTGQVYLVRTGVARPFRESDYDGPVMAEPPAGTLDHRNWLYGIEKRAAEDVLRTAHASRGFPTVSLRMPMIASEHDHYTRIAGYVRRLFDGGPILVPEGPAQAVRHVYGRDVIEATLRADRAGRADRAAGDTVSGRAGGVHDDVVGEAFNISQDETVEFLEMVYRIGALVGRMPNLVPVPRATLERHELLPRCSPFSDPWMSALTNDLSKTRLGMRYTALNDYLPQCVEAAMMVPVESVVGYDKRERELEIANEIG